MKITIKERLINDKLYYVFRAVNNLGRYNLFDKFSCIFFRYSKNFLEHLVKNNNGIACYEDYDFLFLEEKHIKDFSKILIKYELFFKVK